MSKAVMKFKPILERAFNSLTRLSGLLLCLCLWAGGNVAAKTGDTDQPIHIEADAVELHDREGFSVYLGNVVVTQGTIKITGDKITIYNENNELHKVIADGAPARFRQLNDEGEEIRGRALRMEYHANKDVLYLTKEGVLEHLENVFESDRIQFDIVRNVVSAGKSAETGTGSDPERVKVIIHPKSKTPSVDP